MRRKISYNQYKYILFVVLAQPFLGYLIQLRGKIADSYTVRGYQDALLALFICSAIAFVASFKEKETMKR